MKQKISRAWDKKTMAQALNLECLVFRSRLQKKPFKQVKGHFAEAHKLMWDQEGIVYVIGHKAMIRITLDLTPYDIVSRIGDKNLDIFILSLVVAPKYRGKGLGRQLREYVLAKYPDKNFITCVGDLSDRAVMEHLNESMGFVESPVKSRRGDVTFWIKEQNHG